MWGKPGPVLLVSGYVFMATLAAPGLLFASEDPPQAPAAPEAPTPSPAPVQDDQSTIPEEPPAPDEEVQVSAPAPAGPVQTREKEAPATASATRTVAMRNIEFKPRNITIDPGDTVQWRNEDPERHNALGENGSFETPVIEDGETSSHTFSQKGSYPYFCSLHAGMEARITVGASSGGGSGGGSSGGSGGGGSRTGGTGGTGSGTAGSSTGSTGTSGTISSSGSGSTSSLPATGHDLVWLALIGAGLLTLGAALTALAARRVY